MSLHRHRVFRLVACLALVSVAAAPTVARGAEPIVDPLTSAPSAETGLIVDETPQLWFVELGSAPQEDGTPSTTLKREKDDFRDEAARAGLQQRERFAYDRLFNGVSIEIAPSKVADLTRIRGVKGLYPVVTYALPPRTEANPDLATALAMTGADAAQSELGLTGRGVRVAVMDTGIDYRHPDLGGCFGPGCRVVTGTDFVGDAFDASDPAKRVPRPGADPMDCNGHGTHVAGIIGANGAVRGVAPDVTFGAYRVFGCEGSTTADIMLAAMERARADGMQVLNMSIGSAFEWPAYPTARASDRLVAKGMVVVASIGNNGASGVYSAGAPGVGHKVIGVASFDNSHISARAFTANPSGRQVAFVPLSTTPEPPTSGTTAPIVFVGRGCAADPDSAPPSGMVALIERGGCTFNEKYQRAADAGATGVIVYNSSPGLFAGGSVVSRAIFGVGISQADGLHLRGVTNPTVTWTGGRVSAPNPTGGLISSFSSYGLAPDLSLKPDIGAPGGLIRSTYPLAKGGYATLSGTSMASPHVAGSTALLLEARPATAADEVRGILQNSAVPRPWWGNPTAGFLDNVHRQGAGMVRIDDAIRATTRVEPARLALGASAAGPAHRTLKIRNSGPSARTYNVSHAPALSTIDSTYAPRFTTAFAAVTFSTTTLTVDRDDDAELELTITANPGLADRGQYGGYIVLTPHGGGPAVRVPYGGFKGDYQSIQVLTPTPYGFPWLASRTPDGYASQPNGATYTLQGNDVPSVVAHFEHQSRRVRIEVRDATTGKSRGRFVDLEYFGRNSTSSGVMSFSWDGVTGKEDDEFTEVPDGRYVLVLSVLKALGDPENAAHWETWTSPVVTINRPQQLRP